jgi:hypothetical protein
MNCGQAKELFADALVNNLNDSVRCELEAHLRSCASCREESVGLEAIWEELAALPKEQPSAALDLRVQEAIKTHGRAMICAERKTGRTRRILPGWPLSLWPKEPALQFALAVLLFALGLVIGQTIGRTRSAGTNKESIIAELREELANMKQLLTLSLLMQPSPSERLRGVEWTSRLGQADEQVLSALLRVLELDSNVNVRLAAVDTLQQFIQNPRVRKALIDSLARPQSPLVQIDLIHAMVRANEKDSVGVIKVLLQKADIDPTVRERAEWALQKLI